MDIELLSRMIGELILQNDQVGLPGVGTFVAEMVPASFSDKGYTINPPYRRLSFTPKSLEDSLLIDFYATSNHVAHEVAELYLTQYLAEMKAVLEERKTIILPGLGRLRATRENTLFFVADEGLDIFPAGIGLRPVSLKSHVLDDDPVVIDVPLPLKPASASGGIADAEAAEVPAQEEEMPEDVPQEEGIASEETAVVPEEELPGSGYTEETEGIEEEGEEEKEGIGEVPAGEIPVEADRNEVAEEIPDQVRDDGEQESLPERHGWPAWAVISVILLSLAIVALATFLILAHVAPDFIDSLLYSPEELQILNY